MAWNECTDDSPYQIRVYAVETLVNSIRPRVGLSPTTPRMVRETPSMSFVLNWCTPTKMLMVADLRLEHLDHQGTKDGELALVRIVDKNHFKLS